MTQAPIDTMSGESKRIARDSQSSADAGSATTTFGIDPEQGREINPSAEVLGQFAGALLLNKSERAHFVTLAKPVATARAALRFSREVSSELVTWINPATRKRFLASKGQSEGIANDV